MNGARSLGATPEPTKDLATDEALLAAARAVSERAYSPYSKVRVGVALAAADGRVFLGCNVENASYGLTLCAERAAVVRAVADGCREFTTIAIVTNLAEPLPPCGACRQVLAEFASDRGPGLRVITQGAGEARQETTLRELLPGALRPDHLR